jgi:choline kinase
VVSIDSEPEEIEPISTPDEESRRKQHKAGLGKRLMGRATPSTNQLSRLSTVSQNSADDVKPQSEENTGPPRHHIHHAHHHEKLISQVTTWLEAEKTKRIARRSRRKGRRETKEANAAAAHDRVLHEISKRPRSGSQSSDSSEISLDKLQRILEDSLTAFGHEQFPSSHTDRRPSAAPKRKSGSRTLTRTASSDTDYHDGDVVVPSCDVMLDNSKTMSYSGGAADSEVDLAASGKRAEKERKAWLIFKGEIVRLTHTLRLKGWRRVPLDRGGEIEVERLSGALTNAVYVVSPPKDLPASTADGESSASRVSKKSPPKLLLRIYGPQVEHLIDRENELSILRRLARKKIGPRLLGTFRNGRFEEFFNATTLTSADLRIPDTSKQIAKRMRELHDGIDLLERERDEGPFVWRNWDKWVDRCEQVISWVDHQILSGDAGPARNKSEAWKERGLICGVEWPIFKQAIDKYRKFLDERYGGSAGIRQKLVFAHNDVSVAVPRWSVNY